MNNTGSMIIQFEYDEEDIGLQSIERRMMKAIELHINLPIVITHLEASAGTLDQAFGVKGIEK
jgi:hypothetical protein